MIGIQIGKVRYKTVKCGQRHIFGLISIRHSLTILFFIFLSLGTSTVGETS
jgi:hypothetical protein